MPDPVALHDTPTVRPRAAAMRPPVPDAGDLPLRARRDGDCLEIAVSADIPHAGGLLAEHGHRWLDDHPGCALRIDLSAVAHLSSPLAAWLGTLSANGRTVRLRGVNRRVLVQLNLLGLGKILPIDDGD